MLNLESTEVPSSGIIPVKFKASEKFPNTVWYFRSKLPPSLFNLFSKVFFPKRYVCSNRPISPFNQCSSSWTGWTQCDPILSALKRHLVYHQVLMMGQNLHLSDITNRCVHPDGRWMDLSFVHLSLSTRPLPICAVTNGLKWKWLVMENQSESFCSRGQVNSLAHSFYHPNLLLLLTMFTRVRYKYTSTTLNEYVGLCD